MVNVRENHGYKQKGFKKGGTCPPGVGSSDAPEFPAALYSLSFTVLSLYRILLSSNLRVIRICEAYSQPQQGQGRP